jgi:hypothetical protein
MMLGETPQRIPEGVSPFPDPWVEFPQKSPNRNAVSSEDVGRDEDTSQVRTAGSRFDSVDRWQRSGPFFVGRG